MIKLISEILMAVAMLLNAINGNTAWVVFFGVLLLYTKIKKRGNEE